MPKQIITVRDASGTLQNIMYDNRDDANGLMPRIIVEQIEEIIPGVASTNLGKSEDAASNNEDTGVFILAVRRDTPASNVSNSGDYSEIGVSGMGSLWITPIPSPVPTGYSATKITATASTNPNLIKPSAGQIYGAIISNTVAAAKYVKFYNKATAPTVGTDVPIMTVLIPAGQTVNINLDSHGIAFTNGIAIAITGDYSDTGATATAAGDIIANILWK